MKTKMNDAKRHEIVSLATKLIKNKVPKSKIVEEIKELYGFHSVHSTMMVLTKYGVQFKTSLRRGALQDTPSIARNAEPIAKGASLVPPDKPNLFHMAAKLVKGAYYNHHTGMCYINGNPIKGFELVNKAGGIEKVMGNG